MGQYFVIINADKRELLDPNYFGDGCKFGDLVRGGLVGALNGLTYLLTMSGTVGGVELRAQDPMYGRWVGDRVAIIGEYFRGTIGDVRWEPETTYYRVCGWQDGWVDISEHVLRSIEMFFETRLERGPLDVEHRSVLNTDGTVAPLPNLFWEDD